MGFFNKLFSKKEKETLDLGLQKTKEGVWNKITRAVAGKNKVDDDVLDALEEAFITSDVGVDTTLRIIERIQNRVARDKYVGSDELRALLCDEISDMLEKPENGRDIEDFHVPKSDNPYVIMVVGVNGVGKTTTSANIGCGLALVGKKVALVDADIGLRNLDVVMGLENRIVYDLVDVIEGKCKLRQALIKDKRFKELFLLPAAQTKDKTAINEEQMRELTNKLKEEFDYILIDCPAGIEQGFKNAIAGANRALVVTTAEISAIRDADRIIGLLEASEIKNPELIVNRLRPGMVKKGEMMDVDEIVDLLSIDLIGVVPDDEYIIIQTNKGEPVISNKKAPAGKAYIEISRRLLGENIEVTVPGKESGFLAKLKQLFGKA